MVSDPGPDISALGVTPDFDPGVTFKDELATLSTRSSVHQAHLLAESTLLCARRELRWSRTDDEAEGIEGSLLRCGLSLTSDPIFAPLPTSVSGEFAPFTYVTFLDYTTGEHHAALVYGNMEAGSLGNGEDVLVRVHSSAKLGDIFFGSFSTSKARFDVAMEQIVAAKRGIILYMEHDGRGNGAAAHLDSLNHKYEWNDGVIKPKDNGNTNGDGLTENRDWTVAAHILQSLGRYAEGGSLKSVKLLTASEEKWAGIRHEALLLGIDVSPDEASLNGSSGPDSTINGGRNAQTPLSSLVNSINDQVRIARLKSKMLAHRHQLDADVDAPWEAVRYNRLILTYAEHDLTQVLGSAPAPSHFGEWTMMAFGDYTTGEIHRALILGDNSTEPLRDGENVLLRIHSACKTNEIFHSTNCECQEELSMAMKAIRDEGRGIILYLDQEGRGMGIKGKMAQLGNMFQFLGPHSTDIPDEWLTGRDLEAGSVVPRFKDGQQIQTVAAYEMAGYPPEIRDFAVAAEILQKHIGLSSVRMLTNNPRKAEDLKAAGIDVEQVPIVADLSRLADPDTVWRELEDKTHNLGHRIDLPRSEA